MQSENTPNSKNNPEFFYKQYEMMVASAERVTDRRLALSTFYVSLFTLALGAQTFLAGKMMSDSSPPLGENGWAQASLYSFFFAGLVLCQVWRVQIAAYKTLNTAKFKVINEMEAQLPVAIFADEWKELQKGNRWSGLASVESWLPAFLLFLFFAAVLSLTWFLYGWKWATAALFLAAAVLFVVRYGGVILAPLATSCGEFIGKQIRQYLETKKAPNLAQEDSAEDDRG